MAFHVSLSYTRKIALSEKEHRELMSYIGDVCIHGKKFDTEDKCDICKPKMHFGNTVNGIILPSQGCVLYRFTSARRIDEHVEKFHKIIKVLATKFLIGITLFVYPVVSSNCDIENSGNKKIHHEIWDGKGHNATQCVRIEFDGQQTLHTTFVIELPPVSFAEFEDAKKVFTKFSSTEVGRYSSHITVVGIFDATDEKEVFELANDISEKLPDAKISVVGPKITLSNI